MCFLNGNRIKWKNNVFWEEEEETTENKPISDVVDVTYQIKGKTLPSNYLSLIASQMSLQFDWWDELDDIGLQVLIAGEEGNGWFRDQTPNAILYLSRRSRLVLRTPKQMYAQIKNLHNAKLNLGEHDIELVFKHDKSINHSATLYSQHVLSDEDDELRFLEIVTLELDSLGIVCKKILCGKTRELIINNEKKLTRSLMLNDLSKEDSVKLQNKGLGNFQKLGCGIFVPYKSIS